MTKLGSKCCRSASGFSLAEVMIALACISIVIVTTTRFMGQRVKQQRIGSMASAKARVIRALQQAIIDPQNIKASIEASNLTAPSTYNSALKACLSATPTAQCSSAYLGQTSAKPMKFVIADGKGGYINYSNLWSDEGVAGCTSTNALDCPILVNVNFWFTCPVGNIDTLTGGCKETSHLHLMFDLVAKDNTKTAPMGINLYYPLGIPFPRPGEATLLDRRNYAYTISTAELGTSSINSADPTCASYHYIESYSADGIAECKCINQNPTGSKDSLGRPDCQTQTVCDTTTKAVVGTLSTARVNCLEDPSFMCYVIFSYQTCGDHFWVADFDLNPDIASVTGTGKYSRTTKTLVYSDDNLMQCCPETR